MSCDNLNITVIENKCIVEISLQKSFPNVPGILGSDTAPELVDPSVGIPFVGNSYNNYYYIRAATPIIITALAQIAPPNFVGQELTLFTFDDVNTIRLKAGDGFSYNGLSMNGDWLGASGSSITFVGSKALIWREKGRV